MKRCPYCHGKILSPYVGRRHTRFCSKQCQNLWYEGKLTYLRLKAKQDRLFEERYLKEEGYDRQTSN